MRTVFWNYARNTVKLIDQRLLPFELVVAEIDGHHAVAQAISDMYMRGAAAEVLNATRPTSVNLSWATKRQLGLAGSQREYEPAERCQNLLATAQQIADDGVELNRRMGFHAAELIPNGDTIPHHCNTSALAVVRRFAPH